MGEAQFQIVRCATAGVEAVVASTARTFARHTHEQFGIGAIRAGAHRSHSGRGQVEAGMGDAITVNPGEVHDGAPIDGKGRSWSILYVDPAIVQSAARDVFGPRIGQFEYSRPVIGDVRVASAFWRLFGAETHASADPLQREELLLVLTALAGQYKTKPPDVPTASVALARQRIDDDPASPSTLAELAALGDLSRFQLLRSFVRATGLTPHAYLVQRRIDLSRQLIRAGIALAETAAAAGFADQSHMTRTFVKRYGFSPGAYAAAIK